MAEPHAIERGDLFRVTFRGRGHQVDGPHYAVVVSDEPYNWLSTVVVVPFSSSARPAPWRVEVMLEGSLTRALIEQVAAVDVTWLQQKLGSLAGSAAMNAIDEQLAQLLALDYLARPSAP